MIPDNDSLVSVRGHLIEEFLMSNKYILVNATEKAAGGTSEPSEDSIFSFSSDHIPQLVLHQLKLQTDYDRWHWHHVWMQNQCNIQILLTKFEN